MDGNLVVEEFAGTTVMLGEIPVARALVGSPSILLADEPTGNLDSRTSGEIMALFADLNARGLTILLVTHDPQVAAATRRTVRMRDGRLAEEGAP